MAAAKTASNAVVAHPSGDERFLHLELTMKRHQFRHDALIEILHTAQKLFGCLEPDLLLFISQHLKLPPSRVYGVATFYHLFRLAPTGRHACVICTGTACYVNGADELLAAASEEARIGPGATTADGNFSLLTARCIGACGNAPVVVADGMVRGRQTVSDVRQQVKGWLQSGPA